MGKKTITGALKSGVMFVLFLRGKRNIERTFEIPVGTTQFAFQSMLKARIGR